MKDGAMQFGAVLMRSGDRALMGFGVVEEWRAYTVEQAEVMLEDLRKTPGWKMGYLSYDLGAKWMGLESQHEDEFKTPLLHFVQPEEVYVYDEIDFDLGWMGEGFDLKGENALGDWSYEEYEAAMKEVHEMLRRGESYEVNLAHRFKGDWVGQPLELFRRLSEKNPSPYACYLNFDPVTVVSCSPEQLIKGRQVADRMMLSTRPIKGTVPRGESSEEDQRLIDELLSSGKTEAELNMIVDLARNDLGRICEIGSVKVSSHRAVESYSHVHHTMSTVEGLLKKDLDWVDVLKVIFPGGSITGAPKKRTCEIIDRVEGSSRGIYTGSAGWISPEGEFEFNILIRTVAMLRDRENVLAGRYSYHSGGGIVMDSVAKEEWQETLDKAAVLEECLR